MIETIDLVDTDSDQEQDPDAETVQSPSVPPTSNILKPAAEEAAADAAAVGEKAAVESPPLDPEAVADMADMAAAGCAVVTRVREVLQHRAAEDEGRAVIPSHRALRCIAKPPARPHTTAQNDGAALSTMRSGVSEPLFGRLDRDAETFCVRAVPKAPNASQAATARGLAARIAAIDAQVESSRIAALQNTAPSPAIRVAALHYSPSALYWIQQEIRYVFF